MYARYISRHSYVFQRIKSFRTLYWLAVEESPTDVTPFVHEVNTVAVDVWTWIQNMIQHLIFGSCTQIDPILDSYKHIAVAIGTLQSSLCLNQHVALSLSFCIHVCLDNFLDIVYVTFFFTFMYELVDIDLKRFCSVKTLSIFRYLVLYFHRDQFTRY